MTFHNHNFSGWICGLVLFAVTVPVRAGILDEKNPRTRLLAVHQDRYRQLSTEYIAQLKQLAVAAEQSGFPEDAKTIRELAIPFDPSKIQTGSLPRQTQPDLPNHLPNAEAWRPRLRKLREDYARDLYLLSRRLLSAKFPSAAYRLVREVVAADPDHKFARKVLGFQRSGDQWITPFEAQQTRKRLVWHEKFGWLPVTHVKRYEDGERYFRGRWMPAAQESAIRQDFKNAWEIRTEHFLVKTNYSLERGVEVATKLEEYHDFFLQTLVGFFYHPDELQKLFYAASFSRRNRQDQPFVVHYYRTREEYNQALIEEIPQVTFTNGLYHNGSRTAYFFHAPKENNDSTLYHEATHQLFFETRFTPRNARWVGEDANFWIIEGIACYMESLKRENGKLTLGDPEFVRFYWARNRYLRDNFYVPLAQFSAMGMRAFQNQSQQNLSWSYSQSSGLVHFFMHADGGIYRDALVEHLSEIYRPNRGIRPVPTLAELTGLSFQELDQKYVKYLRAQQQALQDRQPLQPASN